MARIACKNKPAKQAAVIRMIVFLNPEQGRDTLLREAEEGIART